MEENFYNKLDEQKNGIIKDQQQSYIVKDKLKKNVKIILAMKSYLLKLKDLNLTIQEVEFQIKFLILNIIITVIYIFIHNQVM